MQTVAQARLVIGRESNTCSKVPVIITLLKCIDYLCLLSHIPGGSEDSDCLRVGGLSILPTQEMIVDLTQIPYPSLSRKKRADSGLKSRTHFLS